MPLTSFHLIFAPGQHPDFLEVFIAPDTSSAREILPGWQDDYHGLCCYDHDDMKCIIVLLQSKLSIPLVVHELTHAAIEWITYRVMPAAAEKEHDLEAYYSEAMACTLEALTQQALAHLWPV